jgi:hypothetical protein
VGHGGQYSLFEFDGCYAGFHQVTVSPIVNVAMSNLSRSTTWGRGGRLVLAVSYSLLGVNVNCDA